MKAYVIKNEDEYLMQNSENRLYFTKYLDKAEIFSDYELAKCDCFSCCEVVEITIAEGDLEQEIAVLKRALELACEDLQFFDYGNENTQQGISMKYNYFIQKAKERNNG